MKHPIITALLLAPALALADPVFQEARGLVVIEAESTSSNLGRWERMNTVAGFTGDCHLEFTGNKPEGGPPASPLIYTFQIQKPGKYQLVLRAHKRLESKREDISNDCYVAMKGDFEAGGAAPAKVLKEDTKMFGGDAKGWAWANTLDAHSKFPAEYIFKEGETYTLTISGRSRNFNFDRIILFHESLKLRDIQKKTPGESDRGGGLSDAEAPESPRETRTLHNKEGVAIRAEILEVNGNTLVALVNGKRFEINIASLSEEDQTYLESWGKDE